MKKYLSVVICIVLISPLAHARGMYMSSKEFVASAFQEKQHALKVLRLTPDSQLEIKKIIGKQYPAKRLRYWAQGTRSAWIINEIGKTEPITVGVVIDQGKIVDLKILVFRESRGWEVRHDFFTDQFSGIKLQKGYLLSNDVDGITGATLSVAAVKKVAKLALYLDRQVRMNQSNNGTDIPAA